MVEDEGFLEFIEFESGKHRTKRWRVKHVEGQDLGVVKWHPAWRRYCFFPEPDTLYDASCLREVQSFLEQEMESRRILSETEG